MRLTYSIGLGLVLCTVINTTAEAQTKGASTPKSSAPTAAPQDSTASPTSIFARRLPPAPNHGPAKAIVDSAVKVAKANNKAVFVHFGAAWCSYCKILKSFLHSPEVGGIMMNYYVEVELTVLDDPAKNNPGAGALAKEMNVGGALPGYFILDGNGKKIGSSMMMPPDSGNIGFPVKPEEIVAFGTLLRQTAPRMTAAERKKVIDYLTERSKDH